MTDCLTAPAAATDGPHVGFWQGVVIGMIGTSLAAVVSGLFVFGLHPYF